MAKDYSDIRKSIERLIMVLRKELKLEAVYLYGSYAKGNINIWSDIDLAIISNDFSNDLHEESSKLFRLAAGLDDRIEPHPFRVDDFEESDPLVYEILKTGIKII